MSRKVTHLKIGQFAVSKPSPTGKRGKVWITCIRGERRGEAGEFSEVKLSGVIKRFFEKEF